MRFLQNPEHAEGPGDDVPMDSFYADISVWWPAGRADLHWHLLPAQRTAERLTATYHHLTHQPGLAPVAPQWLHCTLIHAQPHATYAPEEIDQVVTRVRAICQHIPPITMTLDRPTAGRVAIECVGRPGAPARQLAHAIGAADQAVTDVPPRLTAHYYPHLSLAYGTGEGGADRRAIRAALTDTPGEPLTAHYDRAHLVAQHHDGHSLTWAPVASVPLAGMADAAPAGGRG